MTDPAAADVAPPTDELPETRLSVASGPLVGPVLRRVVGMLAARADLPLDRLDDAVLPPLIAALAHEVQIDHGPDRGSRLEMCFRADSGSLETA